LKADFGQKRIKFGQKRNAIVFFNANIRTSRSTKRDAEQRLPNDIPYAKSKRIMN